LSDVISGFVIMMDQPFRVGDRIEIQDENTWGDVVEIGLRTTRIRIPDNRMVIVPNSVIGKNQVINYTYPDPQYRIETEVRLEYGTELEGIRPLIVKAVRQVDGVLPNQPVEVLFLHFGDSSMTIRIRWWIESYGDARQIVDLVNTAVYDTFGDAGIEIPHPKQDIYHYLDSENAEQISQTLKD
jgi:small-conductance mechanosensitive channel